MNDTERAQWIDNDEGLYNWWKTSRQSKRAFIRENRAAIDAAISPVVEGTKPAHHLAYPRNASPYGGGHLRPAGDRYPLAKGERFAAPVGGAPYPGATPRGRAGQSLMPGVL